MVTVQSQSPLKSGSADSGARIHKQESFKVISERINSAFASQHRRNSATPVKSCKSDEEKVEVKFQISKKMTKETSTKT